MEYTLRENANKVNNKVSASLNPCFNGIYSQRVCYIEKETYLLVLILVLMEYTLRELYSIFASRMPRIVLILVLMEYTLRVS